MATETYGIATRNDCNGLNGNPNVAFTSDLDKVVIVSEANGLVSPVFVNSTTYSDPNQAVLYSDLSNRYITLGTTIFWFKVINQTGSDISFSAKINFSLNVTLLAPSYNGSIASLNGTYVTSGNVSSSGVGIGGSLSSPGTSQICHLPVYKGSGYSGTAKISLQITSSSKTITSVKFFFPQYSSKIYNADSFSNNTATLTKTVSNNPLKGWITQIQNGTFSTMSNPITIYVY